MQPRFTLTLAFITAAPFLTLAGLAAGWTSALGFLFASHVALLINTLWSRGQGFGPVFTRFQPDGREVWLTFDDGPDPVTTPPLLEVLARHGARGTFFLIGERVQQHPELAREILRAGHGIGNHTATHAPHRFWRLGPVALGREIDGFHKASVAAELPEPALFRAPAGFKNPFLHPHLATRGLVLVGWSARPFDTRHRDPARTTRRLVGAVQPGAILLLHEGLVENVGVLDALLANLSVRGFRTVQPPLGRLRR